MVTYQHTQTGTFLLVLAIIVLGILGYTFYLDGAAVLTGILGAVVLVLFSLSTLTVTVQERTLTIRFGWGVYQKHFLLTEVTQVSVVKTAWWHGWGIHYDGKGWLYNVSGLDAVELGFQDGSRCRIGSDEPEVLKQAIEHARIVK